MKAQDAETGTLLVRASDHGQLRPMPILATDVDINVTGMISRSTVIQHFANPTDEWLEGIYVFPLSESAAVDTLVMKIGERVIIGEIEERVKAKKIYEQAKKEGKKASLLEQDRPNIFTTSVANIGPGEVVSITIEYQEDLRYSQGEFSLRFPMVVGPRYIPGARNITGFSGTGWSHNTDQVSDASRITPQVADPSKGPINPVSIHVHIDAGFPIHVNSPSHDIQVTRASSSTSIALDEQSVPADSDFVLEWRPRVGDAPNAALFSDVFQGDTYALLMLMPPSDPDAVVKRLPRETIFVIDTSGSMDGTSIHQAKEALSLALRRLTPEDSFNLIQFNSDASRLHGSSQPATQENIDRAVRYVRNLDAGGGTEMIKALRYALGQSVETSKVRQVIFITDGEVGNESDLFGYIKKNLGRSRLFTVGIGSAPNSHFMTKAAEYGSGSFTFIGSTSEVQKKMGELFSKLESPVLSEIVIDWKGQRAEHWPKYIPDLYLGEPVVIAAKLPKLGAEVGIHGYRGGKPWAIDFKLEGGSRHSGIDRLFARRKIDALNSRVLDGADADAVRTEIVAIGLNHHLVTKHTSLVAVEQAISRAQGESLTSSAIPTNLPKGWVMEGIWAQRDQWNEEMKQMRNEVEHAREAASYHVAKAKMNEKASAAELRKMQEQLRIEQARQLAEATAKASSSTSPKAYTPTPAPSADAAEATVSADTATYATTSAGAAAPKRTATAQGPGALPQTGTGATLLLLVGLLLLGLAFVTRMRRWTFA
jgi:Ca-activated chloride channel family protein